MQLNWGCHAHVSNLGSFFFAAVGCALAGNSDAHDWSGPYMGANIGYAWGQTANTWRSPAAGYFDWEPDGPISYDSVIGGAQAGYLKQFGRLVVGAEIDIGATSLEGNDAQQAGLINAIEINYIGTIRGRLGYAFERSFIYATGGFAYADYTKKDESVGWSKDDNLTGWTVGAGYEYALANHWSARVEYQYIDFGAVNSLLTDGNGLYYFHQATDIEVHSVRAGLNYSF
jgi:outer membrane immunogenic protein